MNENDTELLDKLNQASFSEEELKQMIEFVFDLDEAHPTSLTNLCKRLIITLAKDRLQHQYDFFWFQKRNVIR